MKSPNPLETSSILAHLREHGSALWLAEGIPGDFIEWRRGIRSAARSTHLRISVRRLQGMVLVEHVDHVVTDDQIAAFGRVVAGSLPGEQPVIYEEELHAVARDRLRIVRNDDAAPGT